ncbi:MAG: hypothetical protein V1721_07165 [Pseudomonadota bacterium]
MSDFRARDRKAGVTAELQNFLGLPHAPRMTRSGGDGTDNIYFVSHAGKTLGVLRLAAPDGHRKTPPSGRPYAIMTAEKRIDYEWEMYTKGAAHTLTPKPLWRAHDALLCEHLPCKKLQNALIKDPGEAWNILCRAARAVRKLHEAGITHMDVCLQNMLEDAEGNIYFIDFEYAPAPHIPPPAQRVYDHLRLVEAAWKFIPPDKKSGFGGWLDYFSGCMDDDMHRVDLSLLERDLSRMLGAKEPGTRIRRLFTNAL